MICEKLKILGLKYTWIGDFVQIEINWWNWLVGLIELIILNCFLTCVIINWSRLKSNFFCRFPPILLQGFSPLRPIRLFYPSFCIYFQVSCIFWGNFKPINFWGFLMIQDYFLQIDQWVFVLRCYITVLDGLIWSIWWFVRNWKF